MDVIDTWTGAMACHLQAALRMSHEAFAEHLGVHPRTVGDWHRRPGIVPRSEIQSALDTAYEKAPPPVRIRFTRLLQPSAAAAVQALTVAIAVVVRHEDVLLVCRRDGGVITWQFPAGIVKPGGRAEAVAVQETLGETGVHCTVREHLGSRLHPVTGAQCEYFACDYVYGEAANRDVVENVDVAWAPIRDLARFIPTEKIYPPVLAALEDA